MATEVRWALPFDVAGALTYKGGDSVREKQLKGETWFPGDAPAAKQRLDELTSEDTLMARCIVASWQIAAELARISMRLIGMNEDMPDAAVAIAVPDDIDPNTAKRLVGDGVETRIVTIVTEFIERLPLLLFDRRVRGRYARSAFMTAALAPYLYELCRIVLGAGELNDEKWALGEQAYNPGAPAPEDSHQWQKQVDAWRKRKLGDKQVPVSKLRADVTAALRGLPLR